MTLGRKHWSARVALAGLVIVGGGIVVFWVSGRRSVRFGPSYSLDVISPVVKENGWRIVQKHKVDHGHFVVYPPSDWEPGETARFRGVLRVDVEGLRRHPGAILGGREDWWAGEVLLQVSADRIEVVPFGRLRGLRENMHITPFLLERARYRISGSGTRVLTLWIRLTVFPGEGQERTVGQEFSLTVELASQEGPAEDA